MGGTFDNAPSAPHGGAMTRGAPLFNFSLLRHVDPRWLAAGAAFVLGGAGSASVVAERVTGGSTNLAMAIAPATTLLTGGFALATRALCEPETSRSAPPARVTFFSQLFGLFAAVGSVHAILHVVAPAQLSEALPQLANDVTLSLGLLLIAWSFVVPSAWLRVALPMTAFLLAASYHLTAARWHLDAIAFQSMTVQQFVPAQLLIAAAGLLFAYLLSPSGKAD